MEHAGSSPLLATPTERFTPLHQQTLQAILEPVAAAPENDRRLRELTAREAAEADKQSPLRRLGRTEVTDNRRRRRRLQP
jgi:hypothetical protein